MGTQSSGEQPSPDSSAFSIDLERLTVPEIVFLSRAFLDRRVNKDDHPNISAWGHIDDKVDELAQRDPERGRAIYEGYRTSEDIDDRRWFFEGCLERYISIAPDDAFDAWRRLVIDEDEPLRGWAESRLRNAFSEDEEVTRRQLGEIGITLHQAASLLIAAPQHEEPSRQQQDQV